MRVLRSLNTHMSKWIKHVMINVHHMSEKDAARYEGRIFTTGSYRYNVHTSGSDIDAVLIAPHLVTREHFFKSFVERLLAEPLITEMTPVYTAKVPIIAMKFDGIDMDLSFGSIPQEKVPGVITDNLLRGLDEASVRSANAVRVAQQLLDHAPAKYEFRVALRFIKQWAKVRGIHGSQYGFPTGIGWAILVCNACQCFPNKNAAGILGAFYRMYKSWFVPGQSNTAIFLSEKRITSNEFGQSWNPEKKWDALAVFPVLTPVAPSTNACDMVKEHTLRILCKEFARGHELMTAATSNISLNTTSNSSGPTSLNSSISAAPSAPVSFGVWSTILEPYPFFENHKVFIHIEVSCLSSAVERYKPYFDCVESRLNRLIASGKGIDKYPQVQIRPWPKRFEDPKQSAYIEETLRRQRSADIKKLSEGVGAATTTDNLGSTSSANRANQLPPLVPPSRLLSGHMYIALDIDSTRKNAPQLDLREAVQTFSNAVTSDENNFYQGITMPPKVSMEGLNDIPLWIFDPSKSKVLKQREEEAAALKAKVEAEAEAQKMALEGGDDLEGPPPSSSPVGQKRAREDGEGGEDYDGELVTKQPQRQAVTSFASLTGTMARPQGIPQQTIRNIPAAASQQPAAATPAQLSAPIQASVVVKVTAPPPQVTLLNTDINVDDELGMDF